MPIQRLPDALVNQIAAGEVVERPASVAKELIENSIDAGATRVDVEVEGGGIALLRVTDDGSGMPEGDARLALERHATSKIRSFEDLTNIGSFGFRGEALPSIASVSKLTLTTRERSSEEAIRVTVDGGEPPKIEPAGAKAGTCIEVRELFFNVPARRKFLKSSATELGHLQEVIFSAALSRPELTLTFSKEGRQVAEYLRSNSRAERAHQAWGGKETLAPCRGERGKVRVEAFLSAPERARAGTGHLYLLVNGRIVRDRAVLRAVAQGYGSVLEPGRFPVGVVYIDLPPAEVDVNVHPQKAEVRFADPRGIFDAVMYVIRDSLAGAFSGGTERAPGREISVGYPTPSGASFATPNVGNPFASLTFGSHRFDEVPPKAGTDAASRPLDGQLPLASPQPELFQGAGFYRQLRFLAQLRMTFLLCEGPDGLYILDQHAAAERVTFDRLRRSFSNRAIAMQRLLVPEAVPLSERELVFLDENESSFAALGIEARRSGPTLASVHAVPKILAKFPAERLLRDVLAEASRDATRPFGGAQDLVLATMACHGSVRAGDVVSREEATALLEALDDVDFAGHCPHGRPVITRMSYGELERRVGR